MSMTIKRLLHLHHLLEGLCKSDINLCIFVYVCMATRVPWACGPNARKYGVSGVSGSANGAMRKAPSVDLGLEWVVISRLYDPCVYNMYMHTYMYIPLHFYITFGFLIYVILYCIVVSYLTLYDIAFCFVSHSISLYMMAS